jgi:hypothetical protein
MCNLYNPNLSDKQLAKNISNAGAGTLIVDNGIITKIDTPGIFEPLEKMKSI